MMKKAKAGGIIMKKITITITAALMLLALVGCSFAETPLDALVKRASDGNPLIMAARERVNRARAELDEARAGMGPKGGVALGALVGGDEFSVAAPAVLAQLGITSLQIGSRNTYAAAVGFMQTIYAGGSLTAMKQAKSLALDAARAEEARTEQSVTNAVRVAYFNRKRAEEKQSVAEEAVTLTKNHLARAEKLFNSGVVAKGDVLRSKVAVAESELDLIRAKNAAELSLTALERAVGSPVSPDEIKGGVPRRSVTLRNVEPAGPDPLEAAYENRQELKMYSLLSRQAEKVAKAAAGQSLPQIVAGAAYFNADDSFFPSGEDNWKVGIAAYWSVFDSGRVKAKTNQAKAQARELLHRLDDMKNAVRMEVVQAQQNLRSAQSRLEVAERQAAVSEEDYRIAKRRYEEQVGTNLDMLDARLALTNSRTELVDALYDIETARANLAFAVGKD